MTTRSLSWLASAMLLPTAAPAQIISIPLGNSSIAPAPQALPPPEPMATATPTPFPSPVFSPAPLPPAAVPTAGPTPGPAPAATPTPRRATAPVAQPIPAPAASPTPTASPAPVPPPSVAPSAAPTREPIETVVLPQERGAAPLWPWLAGAGGLALLALTWVARRRRRDEPAQEPWEEAGPEPAPAPVPPPSQSGRLALALRPVRAGLNLISATAECEVTVANIGDGLVGEVRVALELMSAREGQGDGLAAFFAQPVGRPAVPAFTLQPGEERSFRTVAALWHDAIHPLDAGGRPMFVPLLALSAHYQSAGETRRIGQAFAVGVERADSAKLGPFWLDTPPRLYDTVAARAHGAAVEA